MSSVGSEFPKEQERVRHLREEYLALPNGAGVIGATILDDVLARAAMAQSSGDVIQIIQLFQELKDSEGP